MSELGQRLKCEVLSIASANPDFVYEIPNGGAGVCLYVHDGEPSCLIGRALWNLRIINASMETGLHNDESFDRLAEYLKLDLDSEEIRWLRNVQYHQDRGRSWGYAVSAS